MLAQEKLVHQKSTSLAGPRNFHVAQTLYNTQKWCSLAFHGFPCCPARHPCGHSCCFCTEWIDCTSWWVSLSGHIPIGHPVLSSFSICLSGPPTFVQNPPVLCIWCWGAGGCTKSSDARLSPSLKCIRPSPIEIISQRVSPFFSDFLTSEPGLSGLGLGLPMLNSSISLHVWLARCGTPSQTHQTLDCHVGRMCSQCQIKLWLGSSPQYTNKATVAF